MADVKTSVSQGADRTRDRIDVAPRFTQADVIRLNNLFRGQDAAEVVTSVIGAGLLGLAGLAWYGARRAADACGAYDPGNRAGWQRGMGGYLWIGVG